jgi:hypothetical protein
MTDHWRIEMKDALDVVTDDPELAGEITLLTELMVAVAHTRLDQAAIDAILHASPTSVRSEEWRKGSRMADI